MTTNDGQDMLLGRQTPVVDTYAPELLFPIPRLAGREQLALAGALPFYGVDLWHAYEISWLDRSRKPVVRVGRITVPATSANMIESKSLKLYLNSLNNQSFDNEREVLDTISTDLSEAAGTPVAVELCAVDDRSLAGQALPGFCLDDTPVQASPDAPAADMLVTRPDVIIEESLYSHLLRSLCPVTGQPDWASVWVHYRGPAMERASLLRYFIAYRTHQEFHEQCVERMFMDIYRQCAPQLLQVQAFYTRRGGLDINPLRTTEGGAAPLPRLDRQ